jgi:hypothetical protein
MARFHPVSPGIWNHRLLRLGHVGALVYAYILSNEHRNSEGLYRLPLAYICADLELDKDIVTASLSLLETERLIDYDHHAEIVLDRHALKFLRPVSERQVTGAINKILKLPPTALLKELHGLAEVHAPELATAMKDPFPELAGTDTQDSVSEQSPRQSFSSRYLGDGSRSRFQQAVGEP